MKKICLALSFIMCCGVYGFAQTPTPTPAREIGSGVGNASGNETDFKVIPPPIPSKKSGGEIVALRILSKPRPAYTDEARKNAVEGFVRLRVTFLASGEIGVISPVSGLSDGLTEQAIAAARQIKFEPTKRDGVAVSVAKVVEYSFSILFNENDKELAQNATILEMPNLQFQPSGNQMKKLGGKIKVSIALSANGTARVLNGNELNLPPDLLEKINEAVAKIKFNPAIHRNGNAVTQMKIIEYVFSE